jgi:predicted acylesterase/phospholipase RssA
MTTERVPVSVVLGGGGAKGFVHIGVLEELVSRGFDIKAIFGTSIGSIIGALFAYHCEFHHADDSRDVAQHLAVDSVKDLLLTTDFIRLADINVLSPLRRGAVRGKKIRKWLDMQLLDPTGGTPIRFRDLKEVDLNVMVTDALTGDGLVASRSTSPNTFVSAAVRASMSIQGVFLEETLDFNERAITCWDGGVTGNCRFDLSQRKYPDMLTVASSVTYRGDPRELPNSFVTGFLRPILVADRSADFWLRQIENLTEELLGAARMANVVLVRPAVAGVSTTGFAIPPSLRRTLIENGRLAASAALGIRRGVPLP